MAIASESSPRPTRRELLRYLPAGLLAPLAGAAGTPKPSLDFPTQARARLAVTSYPFRTMIESATNRGRNPGIPGMDLTAFPAFAAEKFGIANINPLLDHFGSTDRTYIDAFRAALEKSHSRIVDLGLAGRRFYAADSSIRREAIAFGKNCVDIAVQVGTPSVRQHVAGRKDEKPDVALAAASFGELAEHGAKRNIVINLENDSPGPEDPFFLVAVIEKVNNPYLRALPDFGNSLIGHDDSYNHKAVKAMLGHAFNMCHVKDTVRGDDGKRSQVDLKSMFELARAASYRGYFSMEFDTDGGDAIAGTKRLVEETLQHLS